jgi:hypothetical protein
MQDGTYSARLILNIEGKEKGYVLWNGTEAYYQRLRSAYKDVERDADIEYLHFGFFTLSAATLEYSLNFILTDFCLNHYGHQLYKSHAEGYMSIGFAKKLLMAPSIISKGTLVFKEETETYITLIELIKLRNRLLHNKEFLTAFDTAPITLDGSQEEININFPVVKNDIDSLTKEICLKFGKALGKFKTHIMDKALGGELTENELLKKV